MDNFQKMQLRMLLNDVDVYCTSAKNAVYVNKVREKEYFNPEVMNFRYHLTGKSLKFVCSEIARLARKANKDFNWEEYDVDGFCWNIAVYSLICETAGIVPNFETAFKEAYKIYINEGLETYEMNNWEIFD